MVYRIWQIHVTKSEKYLLCSPRVPDIDVASYPFSPEKYSLQEIQVSNKEKSPFPIAIYCSDIIMYLSGHRIHICLIQ